MANALTEAAAPSGTITGRTPGKRERLANALQDLIERAGVDRYTARKWAQSVIGGESSNMPLNTGLVDATGLGGLLDYADNPQSPAMFIGPLSKTWNKAAATQAETLEKAGKDARAIWKETGTFRGPDGALRQEIDDSAALVGGIGPPSAAELAISRTGRKVFELPTAQANTLREEARAASQAYWAKPYTKQFEDTWPLFDKVAHDPLRSAYPDLSDINVGSMYGAQHGGLFDEATQTLRYGGGARVGGYSDPDKSVALHELQHAIQQREGWARGGSPDQFATAYDEAYAAWNARRVALAKKVSNGTATPAERFEYSNSKWVQSIPPNEAYRRLAGEAEARATQSRMNLNAAQRRDLFPLDSYDVPLDQLIVTR